MTNDTGKVTILAGSEIWPHELRIAEALIRYGYDVEFPPKDKADHQHSADAYINGILYEMKAP